MVPHLLLKIKGWKRIIGHPIDQGKYATLEPKADLPDHYRV